MIGLSVSPSRRQRWTSIAWNRRPSPSHGASMRSVAPAAPDHQVVGGVHERRHLDPPVGARDAGRARQAGADGRLDHPEATARVVEHGGHLLVDAGLADVAVGDHPVGVAEHHRHQLGRVDPEVEQRAAAEGDVEEAVGRVDVPPEPEVGLDQARVTDPLLAEQVPQHGVRRQEPAPQRLHQEQPSRTGVGHHRTALQSVEGERLLAQHGLARGEEQARVPFVGGVRRGDVHDVDVGVGREILVASGASAGRRACRRRRRPARPTGSRRRRAGRRRAGPARWRTCRRCVRWRRCPSGWGRSRRGAYVRTALPSPNRRPRLRATSVWTHVQSGVHRRGGGRPRRHPAPALPASGGHRRAA